MQEEAQTKENISLEVDKRLSWNYPFAASTLIPAKISVTELKRRFEKNLWDEDSSITDVRSSHNLSVMKKPLFMEGIRGLSAAEKGTILHFVMQQLKFEQQDLELQLQTIVQKDLITQQQADSVDLNRIRAFLQSALGKRLTQASNVRREVRFNLEIPCHEVFKEQQWAGQDGSEALILQGVIDCFFEEEDGLVLIDYKTDQLSADRTEEVRRRYRLQIDYYTLALEKLTGKRVKEKYIYFFSSEEAEAY